MSIEKIGTGSPKSIEQKEAAPEHLLEFFPWADEALGRYKIENAEDPEKFAAMREVLYTLMDQQIENTAVFEKEGTIIPYTVIKVGDLARAIYIKWGGTPKDLSGDTHSENKKGTPKKRVEFFMTSALNTVHGHPFNTADYAIHRMMVELPGALDALEKGEEPVESELYTLGFPTNELGSMTAEFTEGMVNDPFKTLGNFYAESIKHLALEDENSRPTELVLTGKSMGASFGMQAASVLAQEGLVTQNVSKPGEEAQTLPHMTVNLLTPPGLNESARLGLQIPLGFVANGVQTKIYKSLKKSPTVPKTPVQNKENFLHAYEKVLEKKGIYPHMEEEQRERKNKVAGLRKSIIQKLSKTVPVDPSIKANKIIGLQDLTTYSRKRNKAISDKVEQVTDEDGNGQALGTRIIREANPKHRTFAVPDMNHDVPIITRENEYRRWDAIVKKLRSLKENNK